MPGLQHDLPVVVVDAFQQFLDVGLAEMFGGYAEGFVHEVKAGLEVQREETPERVGLGEILRRPVGAEGSVASARDVGDVAQPQGINIGGRRKRPRAALRPSRYAELAVSQCIGDRRHVVGPAGIGARCLGAGLSDAGPVYA